MSFFFFERWEWEWSFTNNGVDRLGELVMLNSATHDEGAEAGVELVPDDITITSAMLDKFDLGSTSSLNTIGDSSSSVSGENGSGSTSASISSAMSSVYGGASASGNGGSSRTSSPTRKGRLAAALFHRKPHNRTDGSPGSETNSSHHDGVDGNIEGAHESSHDDGDETPQPKHTHSHHHGHHKERSKHKDKGNHQSETERLSKWLSEGNVIYKSVGLGLMDLTVGMHLVKYAQERGVGTTIQGF